MSRLQVNVRNLVDAAPVVSTNNHEGNVYSRWCDVMGKAEVQILHTRLSFTDLGGIAAREHS